MTTAGRLPSAATRVPKWSGPVGLGAKRPTTVLCGRNTLTPQLITGKQQLDDATCFARCQASPRSSERKVAIDKAPASVYS